MTIIQLKKLPLEKWLHQNEAQTVEIVEGCLLDNMLIECKRGIAAIYEKAVNEWSSVYEIRFSADRKNSDGGLTEEQYHIWEAFMKFADEAAEQAEEAERLYQERKNQEVKTA